MEIWEASYVAGIIDGEGSITLTKMHENEFRRPCVSIASTDKELLIYIQSLTGGVISQKRNYNPDKHKDSYTLVIKNKKDSFMCFPISHSNTIKILFIRLLPKSEK
jgi:hypothetical protein